METTNDTTSASQDHQALPWYRYGWPWFLISFPAMSMVLGAMMLYLGLSTNNSMVVGDYYKEGKAINQRIERDQTAALLGLRASLSAQDNNLIVDLSRHEVAFPPALSKQAASAELRFTWPQTLQLRWVHVTQAARDGQAVLRSIGGNRFIATNTSLPEDGKFRLHIQPAIAAHWRLVSASTQWTDAEGAVLSAPEPGQVFNQAALN